MKYGKNTVDWDVGDLVLWTIDQIKEGIKGGYLLTDLSKRAIYRDDGYDI